MTASGPSRKVVGITRPALASLTKCSRNRGGTARLATAEHYQRRPCDGDSRTDGLLVPHWPPIRHS